MISSQDPNRVIIFDTTLRDGEQSPGASMNLEEKLRIAQVLEEMGVDVIEAGFPAGSDHEIEAVRRIAAETSGPIIMALCRAVAADIDAAWSALAEAAP